ncbi:MAG: hypothetical protein P4N59_03335 [Negativicutes bacterium]|nr:hypothetical protein [Negativicutes bacterium]
MFNLSVLLQSMSAVAKAGLAHADTVVANKLAAQKEQDANTASDFVPERDQAVADVVNAAMSDINALVNAELALLTPTSKS